MNPRAKKIAAHLDRAPEILRCFRHTRDWLRLSLSYTGLRQNSFPYVAQFRDGLSFEFRELPDLATWWQIFYRNVYPVGKRDLTIVDAGANIGAFTLYAAGRAPGAKVLSIEPFPETFSRLEAAVKRSRFADRVELVNAALSSQSGWVSMQGDVGSQFRRVVGEGDVQSGVRVRSYTLAEILSGVQGEVDFLKMDIEGSEYASILTCPPETLRRIRRVAMEFHPLYTPDAPKPQNLFRYFEKTGFAAIEIQDHGEGYGMAYFRRN